MKPRDKEPAREWNEAMRPPIDPDIDVGAPTQEEIYVSRRFPDTRDIQVPPALLEEVDTTKLIAKHLPKQANLDKILKQIQQKVLRQSHFPESLKDIQAAYCHDPDFKDLYLYLMKGHLPNKRRDKDRIVSDSRYFFVLDGLLFRILPKEDFKSQLCIPASKAHVLLDKYHTSLVGMHAGISKTCYTLTDKYYCPRLAQYVRAYITGCHTCQMFKTNKKQLTAFEKRINYNAKSMSHVAMDIKHMPPSNTGCRYMLLLICELTKFIIAIPIRDTKAESVIEAFKHGFIKYFGTPTHIVCDQDPAFMSHITQWFFNMTGMKPIVVSPTNHKSLQAEHGIKSIANALAKVLHGKGENWTDMLPWAVCHQNRYNSPNLHGHSPFELLLGHKPKLIPEFEISLSINIPATYREYYQKLKRELDHLKQDVLKFRDLRNEIQNKGPRPTPLPRGNACIPMVPTRKHTIGISRKIKAEWVGPLYIYKVISPQQFLLADLEGYLVPKLVEATRLKAGNMMTSAGPVTTLAELKSVLRTGRLPPKQL